jgi:hypothetical protein
VKIITDSNRPEDRATAGVAVVMLMRGTQQIANLDDLEGVLAGSGAFGAGRHWETATASGTAKR